MHSEPMTKIGEADTGAMHRTSPVLLATRHAVAWLAVYAGASALIGRSFEAWPWEPAGLALFAALVAGALALFFTKSQAAKSARNFAVSLWIIGALAILGHWNQGRHAAQDAAARPASAFSVDEAYAPAK